MNTFFKRALLFIGISACIASSFAATPISKPTTQSTQQQMTPAAALSLLKEGNARFIANKNHHYDYYSIRQHNAKGQHPFAIVLSCVDSRSIPDVVFDQAPGNIFVARVAGNVVNPDMLGSMEFATKYAGAKLIVVMGHTACGAVKGACTGVSGDKNLAILLRSIQPAVNKLKGEKKNKSICQDKAAINSIAKYNVLNQMRKILQNSPTLRKLVASKQIMLVGAMHNLATGKVTFIHLIKPVNSTLSKSSE